jgi:hypothetical protein
MPALAARSPRLEARAAGALYLVVIATGLFAEAFVRGAVIVSGDPAATTATILAHQGLWRLGYVADLIAAASYVAVTFLLYDLLRAVSATLSLGAAFFGLIGSAVMVASLAGHFAPLALLDGGRDVLLAPDQLNALVRLALKLHSAGYNTSMLFFGCHLGGLGWLVLRSTFLPRVLGVLLAVAGVCTIFQSLAVFLAPPIAHAFQPFAGISSLVGEGGLALWLVAMGVNAARWRDQMAMTLNEQRGG